MRLGLTPAAMIVDIGSDARLLFVLGSGNRVPPGIAINIIALVALGMLLASRRTVLRANAHVSKSR